ncbi:MAG: hypothetical protein KDD36_11565 [Flavobacteriales bacterium]|nr:hypothetical protein [Flavobacteriales bacterium]
MDTSLLKFGLLCLSSLVLGTYSSCDVREPKDAAHSTASNIFNLDWEISRNIQIKEGQVFFSGEPALCTGDSIVSLSFNDSGKVVFPFHIETSDTCYLEMFPSEIYVEKIGSKNYLFIDGVDLLVGDRSSLNNDISIRHIPERNIEVEGIRFNVMPETLVDLGYITTDTTDKKSYVNVHQDYESFLDNGRHGKAIRFSTQKDKIKYILVLYESLVERNSEFKRLRNILRLTRQPNDISNDDMSGAYYYGNGYQVGIGITNSHYFLIITDELGSRFALLQAYGDM